MTKAIIRGGAAAALALSLSACAGVIDPDAELDPEVMEDPIMKNARDESTPQGVMGNAQNY